MEQNIKHRLAFLIVFTLSLIVGGIVREYNQIPGLFLGFFLIGFFYLMLFRWFPEEYIIKRGTINSLKEALI